jgi:hypothetical protein
MKPKPRKIGLAAAIWLLAAASGHASARPYEEVMSEAQAAFAAEDYETAGERLDEAQLLRPYSLFLIRNRILTRLMTNRDDEALAIARDVADRGLALELPPHQAFTRMKAMEDYAPIATKMAENVRPIGEETIVSEIAEDTLLPEAISRRAKRTLIGSVRRGEIWDASAGFTRVATLDGGVFDLEQNKKSIFAAINNQLAFERRGDRPAFAAIAVLDARTGAQRLRIEIGADALVGDIEIDADGLIYASDSLKPRVFVVAGEDAAARVLASDERWANPQGIALDRKRDRLYLADYLTGLFAIDLATGAVAQVGNPSNAHLGGIDGLYSHHGDLIGVQNGTTPQRVVRIRLDKAGNVAMGLDVLAQALETWNEPTHGAVVGGEFHYIATSNWPAYDDEGKLREGATLEPLRIMSVSLE